MAIFKYAVESDKDLLKNVIKQILEDFKTKDLIIYFVRTRVVFRNNFCYSGRNNFKSA